MSQFVRIRRLHRTPLRIGTINVSNLRDGSVVNLDDPKVVRDMKNSYDRWIFLDRALNVKGTSYPTVQTITLTGDSGTRAFKLTYEGLEGATSYARGTNQTAAALQAALRTQTGDASLTVTGTTDAGPFVVTFVALTTPGLLTVTSPTAGLSGVVTTNATAAPVALVNNMSPTSAISTSIAGTDAFGGATGGSEFAWTMNLPAGFSVKTVTLYVVAAAGAATTHAWLTVATYDGTSKLTYQAATADTTSGTIGVGPLVFSPVVSASTPYVTPFEGQYIFTMTLVTGSSTVATLAGAKVVPVALASRMAGAIPQNVSTYGNPGGFTLNNPWAAALGAASQTVPPAVAATINAQGYTASGIMPYTEVGS